MSVNAYNRPFGIDSPYIERVLKNLLDKNIIKKRPLKEAPLPIPGAEPLTFVCTCSASDPASLRKEVRHTAQADAYG